MSSITTFRGRRCTKVRRNNTIPASSSIATSLTSIATSSLSASATIESSTLSKATVTDPSALTPTTLTTSMDTLQSSGPDGTSSTEATNSVDPAGLTPSTSPNTATLQTSPIANPTTLVSPAFTSSQAPLPVASPDKPATSQTSPADPNSSSAGSPSDQPGADPAPSDQSPKPNAQTTLPNVSVAPSIAASVDPHQSQQPVSTGASDPAASDSLLPIAVSSTAISSGATISSNALPLAISAVSSGSSLISIPGSNPSGTIGNPNAPAHTNGSSNVVHSGSNGPTPMGKATIAGVAVSGVLGGLFLLAIIFLLFRKFRRGRQRFGRQSFGRPLLDRNSGYRSNGGLIRRFGRLTAILNVKSFMHRRPPSIYEVPSPNPIFSNMASRSNSSPDLSPRRRSWSAPAPAFRNISQTEIPTIQKPTQSAVTGNPSPTAFHNPPQPQSLFSRSNRSVSSISHAVYSLEPDSENNPFRDPEPRAPLRIVNPDPSRQGTPSGIPPPGNKILFSTELQFKPPLTMQSSSDNTSQPQTQNPFSDPINEASPSNPLLSANPFSLSKTTGTSTHLRSASVSSSYSKQSSIGPLPQIAVLQPQQQSHVPQPSTTSADSGFVSGGPSPISPQEHPEPPVRNYQSNTLRPSPRTPYSSTTQSGWTFDMNNFGEPGPTRPNTNVFGGTSRISDPFDLDRPEVLGFMSPAIGKQSDVGRSNSNRSVKQKSMSTNDWPITGTIKPVQE